MARKPKQGEAEGAVQPKAQRATKVTVVTVGKPDIPTAVFHALRIHQARQAEQKTAAEAES